MSSVAGTWAWPCGREGFGVPFVLEGTADDCRLRGEESVLAGRRGFEGGRTRGELAIVQVYAGVVRRPRTKK